MSTLEHIRTCPLCEATCGLSLRVEEGQVTRVRGDRDDVFSRGFLCPKGSVLHHVHDDPDRLRRPLVRDTTGELVEASWRDAIADAGQRLRAVRDEHGPGAVAVYIGNPNVHGNGLFSLQALIGSLGTLNVFTASSVDQLAREVANGYLYGDPQAWGVPDLDRTDQVLLLGANPVVSGGSLATAPDWPGRLAAVRARGGRVIVVDPRRTETAEVADEWIPIRPGTDAHLLAGVARLLLEVPGGVDLGPAGACIDGVDRLPSLLEPFTLDAVAARTGIPQSTIRALADALAAPVRTAVHGRVGLQTSRFGTVASWLTDVVIALSGNLDRPGGTLFAQPAVSLPRPDADGPFTTGRWTSPVGGYPECRGELPLAALPDEILADHPSRIRALVCLAGNPVMSGPDAQRMDEAFAALDALVSIDIYRTETNRHAHVVLPPPSHLERSHYDVFFYPMAVRNVANWSPPLFEPATPSEQDLHLRLAAALAGLPEPDDDAAAANVATVSDSLLGMFAAMAVPGADAAEVIGGLDGDTLFDRIIDLGVRTGPYGAGLPWVDGAPPAARAGDDGLSLAVLRAHPHGIDLGPLEPSLPGRLRTPTGRLDLAPAPITADLPRLVDDLADASTQLTLIGRRQLRSNNSWMHNIRVLMKGRPRCTLLVHPKDAAELGLIDGDQARITSTTGSVDAPVEVTDAIAPGVVSLPHGWGHVTPGQAVANAQPGVNSNVLTDPTAIDPLSGTCSINGIAVTVAPTGPA